MKGEGKISKFDPFFCSARSLIPLDRSKRDTNETFARFESQLYPNTSLPA
jgi:hypothetical protein